MLTLVSVHATSTLISRAKMRSLLGFVAFVAIISFAAAATCTASGAGPYFLATSQKVDNPKSCGWYASDSCCNATFDISSLSARFDKDTSANCMDKVNIMLCAACSPQSSTFLSADQKGGLQYKICKSWCSTVYDACKDALYNNGTNGYKKVSEQFATSDAFCADKFFTLTNGTSAFTASGQCFNSGVTLIASMAFLALFAFVAALML